MRAHRTFAIGLTVFKNPRVVRSEQMFNHIVRNAKDKGMIVNSWKTTLLAISAAKSYESRAHFYDLDKSRVDSTFSPEALSFLFSAQVEHLCQKFRCKVWALRHLRKCGFTEKELIKVYKTQLRRSLGYSNVIYHSM